MKRRLSRARSVGVVVLVVLSLLVLAAVWNVSGKPFDAPVKVGDKAPLFTLKDETGRSVSLQDFRGQVVVLNFGTTWCEACVQEESGLDKFDQSWKNKGVSVIKIDYRETPLVVQLYKEQTGVQLRFLLDRDGQVTTTAYDVVPFPTTIILDKQGFVRARFETVVTAQQLEDQIRPLLTS